MPNNVLDKCHICIVQIRLGEIRNTEKLERRALPKRFAGDCEHRILL